MEMSTIIYLDVETTGLNYSGDDEVVEIALVNQDGKVLLNSLVRPVNTTSWRRAEKIHGISPEMVADAPTLDELKDQIESLINGKHVRIYNASFDRQFIDLSGAAEVSCVMRDFAEFHGYWDTYYGNYAWWKLTEAAGYLRVDPDGVQAHRALADAELARLVDIEMARIVGDGTLREGGDRLLAERNDEDEITRILNRYERLKMLGKAMTYEEESVFFKRLGAVVPRYKIYQDNVAHRRTEEEYAVFFFGKTQAEIISEDRTEELKTKFGDRYYTKRNQIADGLISYTEAFSLCGNEWCVWRDLEKMVDGYDMADGVIETPKTTRFLYDKKALEARLAKSKVAQLYLQPTGYTRTELKKMNFTDAEIYASEVTGYKKGCYGKLWSLRAMPQRK